MYFCVTLITSVTNAINLNCILCHVYLIKGLVSTISRYTVFLH